MRELIYTKVQLGKILRDSGEIQPDEVVSRILLPMTSKSDLILEVERKAKG